MTVGKKIGKGSKLLARSASRLGLGRKGISGTVGAAAQFCRRTEVQEKKRSEVSRSKEGSMSEHRLKVRGDYPIGHQHEDRGTPDGTSVGGAKGRYRQIIEKPPRRRGWQMLTLRHRLKGGPRGQRRISERDSPDPRRGKVEGAWKKTRKQLPVR